MNGGDGAPEVVLEEVCKSYGDKGNRVSVLEGVSLSLVASDAIAVTGPSGSGKSTLLNIIGGLDSPSSGRVLIHGRNIAELSEPELARFRNRQIGFVFQEHHLLPQCSALENVLIPTLANAGSDAGCGTRAATLLDRVGMAHRLHHFPGELSGGERQRVAIARALMQRPALVLCDEPTGNLDKKSSAAVADLLLSLQAESASILIVVTHSHELAGRLSRRLLLENGLLRQTE